MAEIPQIRSKEEIYGMIVDAFLSRSQVVNDLNPGSVLDSLFTAFAELGFILSADQINQIAALAIDRATGDTLKRIANDKDVPIFSATPSTGLVRITDTSFQKISTSIYPGQPAPVAGLNFVYVTDASKLPQTGSIYIGRGTASVEGPLSYTSITTLSGYYKINLTGTTTKFHNLNETVVLAQGGNRVVGVGTVCQTEQGVAASAVRFTTTVSAVILDGEVSVDNVPLISSQPGTQGNVPRGAIKEVLGLSFTASAFNDLPLTDAQDDDTDSVLRERIKLYEQSRARGTEVSIKNAVIGIKAPDELKRVVSASVKRTSEQEQIFIIDDGNGYEPIDAGVGLEQVLDNALGGEQEFQLQNPMIVKASVKTLNSSPFAVYPADTLIVEMDGENIPTHIFAEGDFKINGVATAYEIVASINGSTQNLPYFARTSDGGTKVLLVSRKRNEIRVNSSSTANTALDFPTNKIYTSRLYHNDNAAFQDGIEAFIETNDQPVWGIMSNGSKIQYTVDNTSPVTVTLTDAMFQKYGPTLTVNQSQPISIWASVLNDVLPGVKTTVNGQKLRMASRSGESSSAAINVSRDSILSPVGAALFAVNKNQAVGTNSDYTLNLKTGQLEWTTEFQPGDSLTAGSQFTRAKFETVALPSTLALSSTLQLFTIIDGDAEFVAHNIDLSQPVVISAASSPEITITAVGTSGNTAFGNLLPDDWVIFWNDVSGSSFSSGNLGAYRIKKVISNSSFAIQNSSGSNQSITLSAANRIVFVRSARQVQYAKILTGSVASPTDLADEISSQINGIQTSLISGIVRVESRTLDEDVSEIFLAVVSESGDALGIESGKYSAVPSHNGFIKSDFEQSRGLPTFKVFPVTGVAGFSQINNSKYLLGDGTRNELLEFLRYETASSQSSSATVADSSTNRKTSQQVKSYVGSTITLNDNLLMPTEGGINSKNVGDKFILRQGLVFDANDKLTFIVDGDTQSNAYISPVARKLLIKTGTTPSSVLAIDAESNLQLNSDSTFKDFVFNDFKFWTQAKGQVNGVNFVYQDYGPSGSRNGVSFVYPDEPNSDFFVTYRQGHIQNAQIALSSGAERTPNWSADSAFTAGVPVQSQNTETIVFTHQVGPVPNFTAAGVVVGDVVNIGQNSGFVSQNRGSFRVQAVGATSFTVQAPINTLSADSLIIRDIIYPNAASANQAFGSGKSSVTFSAAHQIVSGHKIGLYGTSLPLDYDGIYVTNSLSSTTTAEITPTGINGGSVTNVLRSASGVATITTSAPHLLSVGNYVKVSDVNVDGGSFNTRLALVTAVTSNTFDYANNAGTLSLPLTSALGRADQQPAPNSSSGALAITAISRLSNVVTVTAAGHGFVVGDQGVKIIRISGVTDSTYNQTAVIKQVLSVTQFTYDNQGADGSSSSGVVDSTMNYGNLARAIQATENLQFFPITATQSTTAAFVAANLSTYYAATATSGASAVDANTNVYTGASYSGSGSVTVTPLYGSRDRYVSFPAALTIKKGSTIRITRTVAPSAWATSTSYVYGDAVSFGGSVYIARSAHTSGASSTLDNPAQKKDLWYLEEIFGIDLEVLRVQEYLNPGVADTILVRVDRQSDPDEAVLPATAVTWYAIQTKIGMGEAESYVNVYTQPGVINDPPDPGTFTLKTPLSDMAVGDNAYIIATTADQLARFADRLAVSGLSSVCEVSSGESGQILQVKTETFGSQGSVKLSGGTANAIAAGVDILQDLRLPFVPNSFATLRNTSTELKNPGIKSNTSIQIIGGSPSGTLSTIKNNAIAWAIGTPYTENDIVYYPTTSDISYRALRASTGAQPNISPLDWLPNSGLFRTIRPLVIDRTQNIKFESHGKYAAISFIGSTDPQLEIFLKEGDWLVINAEDLQMASLTPSVAVTNVARSSGISTITTSNPHGLSIGHIVTISGLPVLYSDFNGTYLITSTPTATTFTFTQTGLSDLVTTAAAGAIAMKNPFAPSNRGIFQILRIHKNTIWIDNDLIQEELIKSPASNMLAVYSYDSVMPGDTLSIDGDILLAANAGSYTVSNFEVGSFGVNQFVIGSPLTNTGPSTLGTQSPNFSIREKAPLSLIKQILSVGPSETVDEAAYIEFDSSDLIERFSSSFGAVIESLSKLGVDESTHTGLDAYRYYRGLIRETYRVVYGDPTDPSYQGYRAAGADIDIQGPIIRRITAAVSIRIRSGVPFGEILDAVRSVVAGYVNGLGVGQPVSISGIIAVVQNIDGIIAVPTVTTTPLESEGLVVVKDDERARIVDAAADITVTIVS